MQGVDLTLELSGVLRFASHLIDQGLSLVYPGPGGVGISPPGRGSPGPGQQQVGVLSDRFFRKGGQPALELM